MNLNELVMEIAQRCGGLDDSAKATALMSDLRACGIVDGPLLAEAFNRWRVAWPKRFAPTAAEFREFYQPSGGGTESKVVRDPVRKAEIDAMAKRNYAHMMRDLAAHAKRHEYIKKEG